MYTQIDFYLLGLSFILIHELDAIRCKEWAIFPVLSSLPDRLGMILFFLLHIPLFYMMMLWYEDMEFRIAFNYFLIIHFFLHLIFLFHKKNQFKDWLSWSIITSAALCGLIDLLNQ